MSLPELLDDDYDVREDVEARCPMCLGEGAVGTGLGSFVDASDAMTCPQCGGSGRKDG